MDLELRRRFAPLKYSFDKDPNSFAGGLISLFRDKYNVDAI